MAGPRRVLIAGTAALGMGAALATPAAAGSSGSLSGTISVVTMSITVSPASGNFGFCAGGNSTATQLGFPNGFCFAPVTSTNATTPITIANTGASGTIDVEGSDAVPADGGTHWTLCAPNPLGNLPGAVACTGPVPQGYVEPGRDQLRLKTEQFGTGFIGADLTTTANCDYGIAPNATAPCGLAAGASAVEVLRVDGPTASSDLSTSFTATATWIIVP